MFSVSHAVPASRCARSWEGAEPGQVTRSSPRDIPYHRRSWPVYKGRGSWAGGVDRCSGMGQWVASNCPVHGLSFLGFYLPFFFVLFLFIRIIILILFFFFLVSSIFSFSVVIKLLLSQPTSFPFFFFSPAPHPSGRGRGEDEAVGWCLVAVWD